VILANPQAFFAEVRSGLLGPTLSETESRRLQRHPDGVRGWPLAWTAYGLATAYHETAHTMQPSRRSAGPPTSGGCTIRRGNRPHVAAALGNIHPGDGPKYPGMGFVQSTGRGNARKLTVALHAARPCPRRRPGGHAGAADAARHRRLRAGVRHADRAFHRPQAGRLPAATAATRAEFMAARRIINGQDRADLIADYAIQFQAALQAAAHPPGSVG
jgi:putative chitinase